MRDPLPVDATTGCLLGMAVGDALGLPREGLAPARAKRLFGTDIRHCLFLGRGMISDDTEHAAMTALVLSRDISDADAFARALAWKLRCWILTCSPGAGLATLRACTRLLLGWSAKSSGSPSAGNGPMMRAPVIGLRFANEPGRMRAFIATSTRITHTDIRAERAAQAIALACSFSLRNPGESVAPGTVVSQMRELIPDADDELVDVLDRAANPEPLDAHFPKGPGGYCYDTLLAVLHSWVHCPGDFGAAMRTVLHLGGDADTTGALLGAIMGANLGESAIPGEWLAGVRDWPLSTGWLRQVAGAMSMAADGKQPDRIPRIAWPALGMRNGFVLGVVLWHALRRITRSGWVR